MRRLALVSLALFLAGCGDPPAPAPSQPVAQNPSADAEAKPEASPEATPAPDAEASPEAPKKKAPPTEAERKTFEYQLSEIDRQIAARTKIADKNTRSAISQGAVASLYMARARLSGDYDDYAKAEEFVDRAFSISSNGNGPFMVRAQLNYTLHRLDRIDEDYAKASRLPTRDTQTLFQRELFRSKLAFQRGEYEQAKADLDSAVERRTDLPILASLALYHWKAADFDRAEELYRQALEGYRGRPTEPAAWLHLQLGLMDLDRGRYDEALAHYREGEALIQGYWLIEEHIAEILTLQGKATEAEAMYRSIIERTNSPEFMDALGELLEEADKTEEAQAWYAKAAERYESQLAQFPEAAYGHALEHFLAHGDDPARALQMAERNHALRPNADAKRLLAEAQLAAGKGPEAVATIELALATPMRSADLHATASAVYAAAGNEAKAKEHREAAQGLNPKLEL